MRVSRHWFVTLHTYRAPVCVHTAVWWCFVVTPGRRQVCHTRGRRSGCAHQNRNLTKRCAAPPPPPQGWHTVSARCEQPPLRRNWREGALLCGVRCGSCGRGRGRGTPLLEALLQFCDLALSGATPAFQQQQHPRGHKSLSPLAAWHVSSRMLKHLYAFTARRSQAEPGWRYWCVFLRLPSRAHRQSVAPPIQPCHLTLRCPGVATTCPVSPWL